MVTDIAILNAKNEFIKHIGKITLKENVTINKPEYLVASSLFPLVTKEVIQPKDQDRFE